VTSGTASRQVALACGLCLGLELSLGLAAQPVRAEWIADQLRVELRTGPGERHNTLRVLESGERVQKLSEADGWIQVRASDGAEGWVPDGAVTSTAPASQRLGRLEQELEAARARVAELQKQLGAQGAPAAEVARLRARVAELEGHPPEPAAPPGSSSPWQTLAMGALIMLLGMAIGLVLPRGGVRVRKIKL
jgi:hypothetical protein